MGIFYSVSRAGFFDSAHHASLPHDAVAVSPAQHRALFEGQAKGKDIVPDKKGRPTLRSRATPSASEEQARRFASVKREAARRIEVLAPVWRQINDARAPSAAGAARFAAIDAIRAASDAIEQALASNPDLDITASPLWPAE